MLLEHHDRFVTVASRPLRQRPSACLFLPVPTPALCADVAILSRLTVICLYALSRIRCILCRPLPGSLCAKNQLPGSEAGSVKGAGPAKCNRPAKAHARVMLRQRTGAVHAHARSSPRCAVRAEWQRTASGWGGDGGALTSKQGVVCATAAARAGAHPRRRVLGPRRVLFARSRRCPSLQSGRVSCDRNGACGAGRRPARVHLRHLSWGRRGRGIRCAQHFGSDRHGSERSDILHSAQGCRAPTGVSLAGLHASRRACCSR